MQPVELDHDEPVVDHPYVTCLTTLLYDRANSIADTRWQPDHLLSAVEPPRKRDYDLETITPA
jgi:hypothetical protein